MRIMQFHRHHGSAITLSENNMVATRAGDFCNGIVFSSLPLSVHQKLCLELVAATDWSGAVRLGVTTQDPASWSPEDFPRYVCPDLTNKEGYWARALKENYAASGNRVTFYITSQRQLHYFINNEHKGVLLHHLPVGLPLWAMLDIYGNTVAAKFVPADEAPTEILARGPDAMAAYHKACECGTQPVFRTRLMLVGQERVGKTSLKKALMGQSHDTLELSTDGIDLSASCSFNLRERKAWKQAISQPSPETAEEKDTNSGSGHLQNLEEEYHMAIATNIVQELLHQRRQKEKEPPDTGQNTENIKVKSSLSPSKEAGKLLQPPEISVPFELRNHDLLSEVPERVVELVEQLMEAKENGTEKKTGLDNGDDGTNGKNIVLTIWDFAGQAAYYTTHQVFLTSRAVYVIVFNLCQDLEEVHHSWDRNTNEVVDGCDMSHLDYMDYWMNSIHAHAANNNRNGTNNNTLSPPMFIVGTHRNSLSMDPDVQQELIEEKFARIRSMIQHRNYARHVVPRFYAVENNLAAEDEQIGLLRRDIEEVASRECYMGEQIPIKWVQFEQSVAQLVEDSTFYSSIEQIQEIAKEAGVITVNEFRTLLAFYHDLGILIHYGGPHVLDNALQRTVILKPQWLIDMFKRIITVKEGDQQWGAYRELWHRLDMTGILEEKLIDYVWRDVFTQKQALLGLMDKFDLICERMPPKNVTVRVAEKLGRSFYLPCRLRKCPDSKKLFTPTEQDVVFYLDFSGFLPDGLFHRILTRAIRWSQECGGHEPQLYYRKAKFFLDSEHDFVLEVAAVYLARIKVSVLRVVDLDESEESSSESNDDRPMPPPKPTACAKVRNFLESTLSDLRELWMRRISYKTLVECTCERPCSPHNATRCLDEACKHFINLDECLSNKIVCCEHRRIKTNIYRKWFPVPVQLVRPGPVLPESLGLEYRDGLFGNIEATKGSELPAWVKSAAKLLNGGSEGQDWTALAQRLGYKKLKMDKLNEDLNPGLALIADWILSSGNTTLSVDMLISCLEQMHREDIVEIIQKGQASEVDPPQVFISYQWDSQDEVSILRDRLEKAGYSCWMDIGQMGGGDQLYARVDIGIRNAKVVISCVSPKYIVSHHCNREISLADLLRKPIIPVMYDAVVWPPPGGMSLMFAPLVYINMKGVGGHGGSGIHADLESKYREITARVALYATPNPQAPLQITPRADLHRRDTNKSDHSILSDGTLHPSIGPNAMVIPGYDANQPEAAWRSMSAPSGARRNTAAAPSSAGSRNQVEQVHVAKCAVCTIL